MYSPIARGGDGGRAQALKEQQHDSRIGIHHIGSGVLFLGRVQGLQPAGQLVAAGLGLPDDCGAADTAYLGDSGLPG